MSQTDKQTDLLASLPVITLLYKRSIDYLCLTGQSFCPPFCILLGHAENTLEASIAIVSTKPAILAGSAAVRVQAAAAASSLVKVRHDHALLLCLGFSCCCHRTRSIACRCRLGSSTTTASANVHRGHTSVELLFSSISRYIIPRTFVASNLLGPKGTFGGNIRNEIWTGRSHLRLEDTPQSKLLVPQTLAADTMLQTTRRTGVITSSIRSSSTHNFRRRFRSGSQSCSFCLRTLSELATHGTDLIFKLV
mmetsp:Transcript_27462/g.66688  ORF Transcript_27462/g.66688 Transcript_27462/m.66688 type:complete len:250 (-) Transcript_27462:365-1114(-)